MRPNLITDSFRIRKSTLKFDVVSSVVSSTSWIALLLAVVVVVVVVTLTGCGIEGRPPQDVLTVINGPDPESLDPALVTSQADGRIVSSLFEGLTRIDPKTGASVPGLAESWQISEDGLEYRFKLRNGLRWWKNRPITAQDVVDSWIRVLRPETASAYAGQLYFIQNAERFNQGELTDPELVGVHASNPRELLVQLRSPTPFFLELCAFWTYAITPQFVIEKLGERWVHARPLPTSGAYTMLDWKVNDRIQLKKNPYYWDAENTQTERVDMLAIGSPNTALNLYESGRADVVWDKTLIPNELLDILLKRPDFHRFDYLGTFFLRYNTTHPPLDDPRVRQALTLAIDKKELIRRTLKGGEQVANHFSPPGLPNYNPPTGLSYDLDRARKLLEEAGYPDGKGFPKLVYLFNAASGGGGKTDDKIAVELMDIWREGLGIEIELKRMEWKAYLAAQSALEYDISRSSWIGDYNDPNTFLDLFQSDNRNNRTGWSDADYDQLINEANKLLNPNQRAATLRRAEKILVEQGMPIAPIHFYVGVNYFDPKKIEGIYPNTIDSHPLRTVKKNQR